MLAIMLLLEKGRLVFAFHYDQAIVRLYEAITLRVHEFPCVYQGLHLGFVIGSETEAFDP